LTQKNLKNGVYGTGQLHPEKENGVLCKLRQIFPAFAGLEAMNDKGKEIDMSKLLSILKTGSNLCSMQAT